MRVNPLRKGVTDLLISNRTDSNTHGFSSTTLNMFKQKYSLKGDSTSMTSDSNQRLTHLDESGNIHMVDVTDRPETLREAIARARVRMAPETVNLIESNQVAKGSVLEV